jgi:hypothetical protein
MEMAAMVHTLVFLEEMLMLSCLCSTTLLELQIFTHYMYLLSQESTVHAETLLVWAMRLYI